MMDDKDLGTKQPNTFIGKGSEFVGKLTFDGTVRVDGKVDGEVFSRGTLIIGPGADVSSKIQVDTVILSGTVRGNIAAAKKIEMRAPGKLYGNIKTPILSVEEGVIFEGNCKMEAIEGEKATPELSCARPIRRSRPSRRTKTEGSRGSDRRGTILAAGTVSEESEFEK